MKCFHFLLFQTPDDELTLLYSLLNFERFHHIHKMLLVKNWKSLHNKSRVIGADKQCCIVVVVVVLAAACGGTHTTSNDNGGERAMLIQVHGSLNTLMLMLHRIEDVTIAGYID